MSAARLNCMSRFDQGRLGGQRLVGLALALALVTLIAAGAASPARAEDAVRIKTLQVSVWPEYDDPGVLVMYLGELAPGTAIPHEIKFRLPPKAVINSACSVDSDGKHTNEQYDFQAQSDGFSLLTYKLTQTKFHMEYYYNPLPAQVEKSFTYQFNTLYPVDTMDMDIQQPSRIVAMSFCEPRSCRLQLSS